MTVERVKREHGRSQRRVKRPYPLLKKPTQWATLLGRWSAFIPAHKRYAAECRQQMCDWVELKARPVTIKLAVLAHNDRWPARHGSKSSSDQVAVPLTSSLCCAMTTTGRAAVAADVFTKLWLHWGACRRRSADLKQKHLAAWDGRDVSRCHITRPVSECDYWSWSHGPPDPIYNATDLKPTEPNKSIRDFYYAF